MLGGKQQLLVGGPWDLLSEVTAKQLCLGESSPRTEKPTGLSDTVGGWVVRANQGLMAWPGI